MSLIATLFPDRVIPHFERLKREWEKKQKTPIFKADTERSHTRDETTNNVLSALLSGVDIVQDISQIVDKQPNTVRAHLAYLIEKGMVIKVLGQIPPGKNRRSKDRFYIKQKDAA